MLECACDFAEKFAFVQLASAVGVLVRKEDAIRKLARTGRALEASRVPVLTQGTHNRDAPPCIVVGEATSGRTRYAFLV